MHKAFAVADLLLALDHVDFSVVNHKGMTALHAACFRGVTRSVRGAGLGGGGRGGGRERERERGG